MTPRQEYENRLNARQKTFEELRRNDDNAVSFRTAVFFAGLLGAWVVFGGWGVPWQFLLIPVGLFVGAVVYHESVRRKLSCARRSIDYYQRCLNRLDGQWSGVGPDGAEFLDPQHPYTGDLDIFGEGSLFQLLNSPVTPIGEKTLAAWLAPDQSLPTSSTVLERQTAVHSLHDQLDLRERIAAIGPTAQSQRDADQLQEWLAKPGGLTARWIVIVAIPAGILGIASLWNWLMTGSMSFLIIVSFAQAAFLQTLRGVLNNIKQHSERAVLQLDRICEVVAALEKIEGDAPAIQRLRSELFHAETPASQSIRKLRRLVSQFDNIRKNRFTAPLAFLSMTSLLFACAIDRWRAKHGPQVNRWFETVGELEALLALSQLHFENPEFSFPELVDGAPQFVATELSHPLLASDSAVANDVTLDDHCQMLLVSGSNMSGKSTLMRSVGINTVLAWAGAPVCARQLKLSRLRVAAAMRMQDSLQTGTSHFFAELKRIQLVVELAKQAESNGPAVLFLLDEILHGTNSHDRLVGARGVIASLLETGAIGLVTTHDLALSELVDKLDAPSQNVHFRDEWIDGQMTFDYKMREGVVPKSNALSLMRLLGLDV